MAEKTIIIINLILQCVLIVAVLTAGYLAKIRHQLKAHCLMLRIAIPVQVAAIGAIMLPAMLGYIQRGNRTPIFQCRDAGASYSGVGGCGFMGIHQPGFSGDDQRFWRVKDRNAVRLFSLDFRAADGDISLPGDLGAIED